MQSDIVDHTDHKKKKHQQHKSNSFTINLFCGDYRNLEYKVNEHSSVWKTDFTWVSSRQVSRLHCWQQYLLQDNTQRKVLSILTDKGWEIKLRRSDLKIRLQRSKQNHKHFNKREQDLHIQSIKMLMKQQVFCKTIFIAYKHSK